MAFNMKIYATALLIAPAAAAGRGWRVAGAILSGRSVIHSFNAPPGFPRGFRRAGGCRYTRSNQVAQFFPLRLQIFFIVRIRFNANGHLLHNLEAVTFQADNFFRVIGEQTDSF